MKQLYLSAFVVYCFAAQLHAQGSVNIELENSVLTIPSGGVDMMQSDTISQKIQLSFPVSQNNLSTSDTIPVEQVNLKNENPQSFNVINTFSLLKAENSNLNDNIVIELGNTKSIVIVLPYLNSLSSLQPAIQTTGSHIFINGQLWKAGDRVDFSSPVQVQVVSFNGDVRTYSISISKTSLPYFELTTNKQSITKDWSEAQLVINGISEGATSIKGKGSHYGAGLKNNYALKFGEKKSLLGIVKNKRWLLVANEADKTGLRSLLGYWMGQQLQEDAWTPTAKPVNMSIDGQYMGCYTLVEQPRICKGRLEDGYLLSVEESTDVFEDAFYTKQSKSLFVFEDPETGSKGTGLIRTKDKLDCFEKALDKQDWTTVEQMADLNSIANWLVLNEIAYNTEAFATNTLVHVDDNGRIAMLPAWELKKAFGCETDNCEGFVASSTPWMQKLMKNSNFVTLVKQQYAKAKTLKLKDFIDEQTLILKDAAIGNNTVWRNLDGEAYGATVAVAYDAETERLKSWIDSRLKWLDTQW